MEWVTSCDNCKSEETEILYSGKEWEKVAPDGMKLVRCRSCGLMYLNPRPTPAEIEIHYPDDYAPYRKAIEDENSPIVRWFRQRNIARLRTCVERYSGRQSGRMLDVGSATGLFMNEMAKSGWTVNGIEPASSAAAYARARFDLDVFEGFLDQAPFPPGSFDVITFWDVIEHTFSPAATLARTAELLKPGGLIAINIPNWNSLDRKVFGCYWIGLDPPRHLYVFTRQTMTSLLEKNGFEVIAWAGIIPSYYSSIISFERWLNSSSPTAAKAANRLLNIPGMRLLFEPYFSLANYLQRSGVISVFARKSER